MSKNFIIIVISISFLLLSNASYSQSTTINLYLKMVAEGKVNSVKNKLPELEDKYGEEPGILLLKGVVCNNTQAAIPYYKKIMDKYPNSEFAPHALWRLIQYYSIVSDTTTAKRMLNRFRDKYPTSPFLSPATDAVQMSISDAKFHNREKYHNEVVAENIEEKQPEPTPAILNKEQYGLQVGIYTTKAAAETERERFIKTANLRTEVLEKLVRGEKMYSVVIGNYTSEEQALQAKTLVEKQCKCTSIIYKK